MVRLRDTGWCNGSTARAIATCRALGPCAPLGNAGRIIGRVAYRVVNTLPALPELDLRVRVPIGLVRRTLAASTRSHALSFPFSATHWRIRVPKSARRLFESTLLIANRDAIDDGPDAWDAARDRDGMLGFVFVLDPAGQLDHSVAERSDVDRAFGEDRVIAESLEDMLFQTLVVIFGLELVLFDVLELVFVFSDAMDVAKALVGNGRTPRAAAAQLSRQPSEATDALGHEHPGREPGHRTDHSADDCTGVR